MAPAGEPATQPLVFGKGDDHNGAMEGDADNKHLILWLPDTPDALGPSGALLQRYCEKYDQRENASL